MRECAARNPAPNRLRTILTDQQSPAQSQTAPSITALGLLAASWGLLGACGVLLYAIVRLGSVSIEALQMDLTPIHWAVMLVNIVFMAYSEGYRGFQCGYAPRLAARARYLLRHSSYLDAVLAPLFCMGFYQAPRRRIIFSFALLLMIIGFIVFFRYIPQPWRGILDAGVVVGLGWGLATILVSAYQAFAATSYPVDPEVRRAATPAA